MPESARQRGRASRTVWIDIGSPSCLSKPVIERGDGRIAADSTRGSRGGEQHQLYGTDLFAAVLYGTPVSLPGSALFEPGACKPGCAVRNIDIAPHAIDFGYAIRVRASRVGHCLGFCRVRCRPPRQCHFTRGRDRSRGVCRPPSIRNGPVLGSADSETTAKHPGGTPMTTQLATVPESDAGVRWREWQARGAENDRRTSRRMRTLMVLIGAAFVVWWSFVQLA